MTKKVKTLKAKNNRLKQQILQAQMSLADVALQVVLFARKLAEKQSEKTQFEQGSMPIKQDTPKAESEAHKERPIEALINKGESIIPHSFHHTSGRITRHIQVIKNGAINPKAIDELFQVIQEKEDCIRQLEMQVCRLQTPPDLR